MRKPFLISHGAVLVALLLPAVSAGTARAETQHTRVEFAAEIRQMRALVAACDAAASRCKAGSVPGEERIAGEGTLPGFTAQWGWLQGALAAGAGSKNASERHAAMQASDARLQEWLEETAGTVIHTEDAGFALARRTADAILAGPEFGQAAPPSAWERLQAKLAAALGRMWERVGQVGQRAPWIGKLLEWLPFLGAGAGMLLFLRRNFQRQRLEATLRGAAAPLSAWNRDATDWAATAERAATAGDWREAVHCLYWAAIVRLEGRRAWRHNPARTPREYVRLLKQGSISRESLSGLTGLLERVWYGLRPAQQTDWERARAFYERLSSDALSVAPVAAARTGGEPA